MPVQKRSKSTTADECRDFLLAVVNDRRGFTNRYEDWLPKPLSQDEHGVLMHLYTRLQPLWHHPQVPLQPAPNNIRDLYIFLLRHKLRVVWERACGRRNTAGPAAARLWAETREIEHERCHFAKRARLSMPPAVWLTKTEEALLWLGKNTHKLIKCGNPSCHAYPWFVRRPGAPNQKYCSPPCTSDAKSKLVKQRPPKTQKNPMRLSPEGRARISAGQRRRWQQYRETSSWVHRPLQSRDRPR
jgi:hypothetical protein